MNQMVIGLREQVVDGCVRYRGGVGQEEVRLGLDAVGRGGGILILDRYLFRD